MRRVFVLLDRRDFIRFSLVTLAVALTGRCLFAAPAGLPKHYDPYLETVAAKLKANASKGTPHGFFFVTDLHFARNNLKSGRIIAKLIEKTGITRVFSGGDYQAAFSGKEDPKAVVDRLCGLYRTCLRDPIEAAGGKFLSAKGNHDTHVVVGPKDRRGYTYSARETRDFLMDTAEAKRVVVNPVEKTGMYYYVDDAEAKTRYIVADTSDGKNTAHHDDRGVNYGNVVRAPQLEWLRKTALGTLPGGWHAVVMQHIPLSAVLGGSENAALVSLRRLLETESAKGRLLFDVAGHHHSDRFVHRNGLLQIGVTCDAAYKDPCVYSPFSDPKKLEKIRKTTSEQAFDCIQFGENLMRATRIGAGHDRTFHLKPISLTEGESVRLELCDLRGPVRWAVYDSDTFSENEAGKSSEEICVFGTEHADVSNDGTVRGLKHGDATVVAYDENYNKEVFGVRVVKCPAAVRPCPMVARDGRRLVRRLEGTNEVFELVKDEGFAPARPWRIYVVKATHTDIGLHNSQYIQRHGSVKRIEDAMRLVDADTRADDDPAAYRYVMEGVWFWENYPMDRGEAAAWNVISNYVRRGRMDIACGCAGNHTHLFGPEELRRSALTKRRLLEKWGVGTRTMIMADNPGMSWSIVKPYAEAGMENVIFAPNQWNPLPSTLRRMNRSVPAATWNPDARGGGNYIDVSYDSDRPMVFRWESYDRSTNLLVWCSTQYGHGLERVGIKHNGSKMSEVERKMPAFLEMLERKYPYDVWLACNYFDDEDANTKFADFAAAWNAKWKWPQFVTVGRLDEPFDELRRRFGDKIPTVRGEMTSGWLQHAASVPEIQSAKFAAERRLFATEKAWRDDPNRDPARKRDFDRAWWHLILNDEHSYGTSGYQGRRVFETWAQHRDWIERNEELRMKNEECPERVEVKDVGENAWYRVRVNARGEIESIFDKELGRELLDGVANRLLYTRDNHKTWSDEKLLGAKITRHVYLAKDEKRIDVENRFEHATDLFNTHRYYRHGYIAFPFAVPGGEFKAMLAGGEVIDPYRDQSGYATDAYVAVRDWCAVENGDFGVSLRQTDTFLTEFGEIHPDKTCFTGEPPKGKSGLYSYVFADWLQMHVPDGESISFTTRYSISSYLKGRRREALASADLHAGEWPLTGADFPEPKDDSWTGLLETPRASHGEKDGQLYLLWGADLSPAFDHYELWRDDGFLANVTNEAPHGIPYRVARYVDFGAGSHTTRTYRVRAVAKDGSKGPFSPPFAGKTRFMFETDAVESEGLRVEFNCNGGYVTSWLPQGGTGEVLFRPKCAPWGKDETHGGIPLCWPWFGAAPKEGLPKHGLLRYARWTLEEKLGKSGMTWSVASTPETRKLWPHDFKVVLTFRAVGDGLRLMFTCENTGREAFEYTWGFHPYFAVTDAHRVAVDGVRKPATSVREVLRADGRAHVLTDLVTGRTLTVAGQGNANWLVWNPDVERIPLCRTLGSDEWKGFYCVEPCSLQPQALMPGERRTHGMTVKVK